MNGPLFAIFKFQRRTGMDFPGGTVDRNPPANAGHMGSTLVWGDSTCWRATKPVHHSYWARVPRAHAPEQERPPQWEAGALQLEKALRQQQRPSAAKKK